MKASAHGLLPATVMPWLLGAVVVLLGYSSDIWLSRVMSGEMYELSDDLVLGLVVAIAGSLWLRKQTQEIRDKLTRIVYINHLIRNELQVIVCSAAMTKNATEIKHIEESAGQISWILRELLGPDYVIGLEKKDVARAHVAGGARTGTE